MKKLNNLIVPLMVLLSVSFLTSCEKNPDDAMNNESAVNSKQATVEVMLSGETSHFDAVNLDVQELKLYSNVEGWISIPLLRPGVYSLAGKGNANDILLGTVKLNSGNISALRLIPGSDNSVVLDGVSFPLAFLNDPSSGIDMNFDAKLEAGKVIRIWIDIESFQSVVSDGYGKYLLKPHFRLFSEASGGAISGSVFPKEAMPVVGVYNDTDLMWTFPYENGSFVIRGIREGSYTIVYKARAEGYTDVILKDIDIVRSKTTQLAPVYLGDPFINHGNVDDDKP